MSEWPDTRTTPRAAFDMEDDEFENTVILRYFESQPDKSATEEELEIAVKWARKAITNAVLLGGVLDGTYRIRSRDGGVEFQLAEPGPPPLSLVPDSAS